MYLLYLKQEDITLNLGLFESEENAIALLKHIPNINLENWTINPKKLDILHKIKYKNNVIILSKTMFYKDTLIDIYLTFIPNLDATSENYSKGSTLINGFSIPNDELEQYLLLREYKITLAINSLKKLGFYSEINGKGSQDGEYISYTQNHNDWHFLIHIDHDFIFNSPNNDNDFLSYIKTIII